MKRPYLTLQGLGSLLLSGLILGLVGTDNNALAKTKQPPRSSISAAQPWLPFFDQENNPVSIKFPRQAVDVTPRAPRLDRFDQAVLQLCGPLGTSVSPQGFRQLMANHPEVFRAVKQAVGGQLRSGRRSDGEVLDDLTHIWFKRQGFEHIFCGEIEGNRQIGGLHYVGRYLQLQNEGRGGRLPGNADREEVVPGVLYTVGVVIRQGNRLIQDDLKGYPYVTNAQEMLTVVTVAFKAQGQSEGACLYPVADEDSGKSYKAVLVRKQGAIVTFYPDATPKGKGCRAPR